MIPDVHHPVWGRVITDGTRSDLQMLAVKILLSRLVLTYKNDPTPAVLGTCARDLREFFVKNQNLPKAQQDLAAILGGNA